MFNDFFKDTILIKKSSGETIGEFKAVVTNGTQAIFHTKEFIEPGDTLLRKVGANFEEYIIIEPGYREETLGFPAGYTATIERKNKIHSQNTTPVVNNHYNINGDNSRVNNNSIDNSSNIVQKNESINEIVNAILAAKSEIESSTLSPEEVSSSTKLLDIVEEKAPSEDKGLMKMLLNALPSIVQTMPAIVKLIEILSK